MSGARILIIGANGQIGTELARARWPSARASRPSSPATSRRTGRMPGLAARAAGRAPTPPALAAVVERHHVTQIYLLAAALSANGEKHPQWAWNLNMDGPAQRARTRAHAQAGQGVLAQLDRRLRPDDAAPTARRRTR